MGADNVNHLRLKAEAVSKRRREKQKMNEKLKKGALVRWKDGNGKEHKGRITKDNNNGSYIITDFSKHDWLLKQSELEMLQEAFTPDEEDEIRQIMREELPYIFYKLYLRRKSWTN